MSAPKMSVMMTVGEFQQFCGIMGCPECACNWVHESDCELGKTWKAINQLPEVLARKKWERRQSRRGFPGISS